MRYIFSFLFLLLFANSKAQKKVDFSMDKTEGCEPVSVAFTDLSSGGNIVKRTWSFGDGQPSVVFAPGYPSGQSGPGRNYITANVYSVTLTVQFDDNSVLSQTKTVNVYPRPVANFDASTLAGCKPLPVDFKDKSTAGGGTITDWFWNFGSGNPGTSTAQNASNVVFNSNGSSDVVLYVVNSFGCKSDPVARQTVLVYDRAVPSFSVNNTTSCTAPLAAIFTNTTTGTGSMIYNWDFGDGSTSTIASPAHMYLANGTYNVSLTVSNGINCTNSAQNYRTIYVGTPTLSAIAGPDQICANANGSFSTTCDMAGASIKWQCSDGVTFTGGNSYSRSFAAPGTYTITAQAINNGICAGNMQTKTIVVNANPVAAFSVNPLSLCKDPFTVQFTNSSSGGSSLNFTWSYGDGSNTLNPTFPIHSHIYATEGIVTAVLNATDKATGCSGSATASVDIRRPQITITNILPADLCEPPAAVTAQAAVSNLNDAIQQYVWDFNDGPASVITNTVSSSANSASYIYTTSGTKSISVKAVTASGCEAVFTKAITINDDCAISTGSVGGGFVSFYGDGSQNCQNKTTFTFTDPFSAQPANNSKVVSWNFGDGDLENAAPGTSTAQHTYNVTTSQSFIVTLTRQYIDAQGKTRIEKVQQTVDIVLETADFKVSKTSSCTQASISFTPNNINSTYVSQYQWDFGDGSGPTIRSNPSFSSSFNGGTTHKYALPGVYNVKLVITDKLNCKSQYVLPQNISINGPVANFAMNDLMSCKQTDFTKPVTDLSVPDIGAPIVKWEWYIGSPLPATPTMVYNAASPMPATGDLPFVNTYGTYQEYNVKLVVTDANGCVSSSHTLSPGSNSNQLVKSYWSIANFYSNNTLQCNNYSVFLNNTSQGKSLNYLWTYGDGLTSALTGSHPHDYSVAGDGKYTVDLIVAEAEMPACTDTKTLKDYIVITKPVSDFEVSNVSSCAPVALNFSNRSLYANTYSWDFGDGTAPSAETNPQSHIYAAGGDYYVTLTVTGLGGCVATKSIPVNVKGPSGQLGYGKSTGCVPFDFTATVTGSNIASLAWDFRDGSLVNTVFLNSPQALEHIYTTPGKYLPNVILSSVDGCTMKLEMDKEVIADDIKAGFTIDKTEFCTEGTLVLTNGSSAPPFSSIVNYLWTFGDGSTSTDADPQTHYYTSPGAYDVTLNVVSQYGQCTSAAGPETVSIHDLPTVTLNTMSAVCENELLQLVATVNQADEIAGYSWLVNDVIVPNENNGSLKYRFTNSGSYNVKVIVVTKTGCMNTAQTMLTVNPLPKSQTIKDSTICRGSTIQLYASDGAMYHWYAANPAFDNGEIATPFATVTPQATIRYYIAITNEYRCSQLDSVNIFTNDPPSLTVNDKADLCPGSSIQLHAKSSVNKYEWSPADGLDRVDVANPIASPVTPTVYSVTAFSNNVCADESKQVSVTILEKPALQMGPDLVLQAGQRVILSPTTDDASLTYSWQPLQGLSCYNCKNPELKADKNVTYRLTVSSIPGCDTTGEINIKVLCGDGAIAMPNAFTPNGDGNNDVFCVMGWGIQQVKSFRIYDRLGRLVFIKENIQANDKNNGWNGKVNGVDVAQTTTFVYIADIICNEGKLIQQKGTVVLVR